MCFDLGAPASSHLTLRRCRCYLPSAQPTPRCGCCPWRERGHLPPSELGAGALAGGRRGRPRFTARKGRGTPRVFSNPGRSRPRAAFAHPPGRWRRPPDDWVRPADPVGLVVCARTLDTGRQCVSGRNSAPLDRYADISAAATDVDGTDTPAAHVQRIVSSCAWRAPPAR